MNYQDQYKKEYAKELQQNVALVRKQLKNKDVQLVKKIKKRSDEYGIPVNKIIDEIFNCDTAVIPFVKIPAKQNFYEKTAVRMIKEIEGVLNFNNLPNNQLYVCNGAVFDKDELRNYPSGKTLDFKWEYKNYTIYASHKYTKDTGGAQDSQYKELQEFIKECRDTKLSKTIFIAIADGDYYFTENGRAGTTKIEHLKSLCTQKTIACRMENLKSELDTLCN